MTQDDWGLFRWLNSRVATLLAWPFTSIKDPMSGFFRLAPDHVLRCRRTEPRRLQDRSGAPREVSLRPHREVPIAFANRIHGESKLSLREQLRYLRHVRRLFMYRTARGAK